MEILEACWWCLAPAASTSQPLRHIRAQADSDSKHEGVGICRKGVAQSLTALVGASGTDGLLCHAEYIALRYLLCSSSVSRKETNEKKLIELTNQYLPIYLLERRQRQKPSTSHPCHSFNPAELWYAVWRTGDPCLVKSRRTSSLI